MSTENKQEKTKDKPFINWLNKAGQSWKDFWDTPVTIQYAYNPHAVVGNGGAPFSTTQRRGDFATQTAAAVAIPATAAGVATVGVVPTLVGMGAGMGVGTAADVGGAKLVELAGGDENAQEMVGDIAGFTFGTLAGGKATKATTNYLNFWNSQLSPESIYTVMAEGLAPTTTQNYGLVKYYGPTMGKTTAARTNSKLVDFDDIVRGPIAELAEKKGVTPRDLKIANDPDYISLLETEVARWRINPANAGKTLVISNKALSSSTAGYNNQPSIPDKETFIARQVQRGGNREEAAAYYDALIENNPNLKIDNRFVSDIESGTRSAKISEEALAGTPKVIRNQPVSLRRLLGEGPYDELAGKGVFGALIGEGSESAVYQHSSDPTKVLKVNVDINGTVNKGRHAAIKRYIDQRNSLGIQQPIELEGVVLSHGQYRPVFSQKKVQLLPDNLIKDYALWREYEDNVLEPFLLNQGFKRKLGGNYEKLIDGQATYQIGDISPYNIGVDADGNPILFDVDIVRRDWKTGKLFKSGGKINYLSLMNNGR